MRTETQSTAQTQTCRCVSYCFLSHKTLEWLLKSLWCTQSWVIWGRAARSGPPNPRTSAARSPAIYFSLVPHRDHTTWSLKLSATLVAFQALCSNPLSSTTSRQRRARVLISVHVSAYFSTYLGMYLPALPAIRRIYATPIARSAYSWTLTQVCVV